MIEVSGEFHEVPPPACAPEAITEIPGKRVAVIGVEHGGSADVFPDKDLTERLFTQYFGHEGPDALVIDSFPRLNQADVNTLGKHEERKTFLGWTINYAKAHGTPIIGADFHQADSILTTGILQTNDNRALEPALFDNYGLPLIQSEPEYQTLEREKVGNERNEDLVDTYKLVPPGMLLGAGVVLFAHDAGNHRVSRRTFLKAGGAAALAGGVLVGENLLQNEFDQTANKAEKELTVFIQKGAADPQIGAKAVVQRLDDRDAAVKLYKQGQPIPPAECASPEFQRDTRYLAQSHPLSVTLRNAVIAEVLSQPNVDILPQTQPEQADIATVLGTNHLAIDGDKTVSHFLTHEQERRQTIQTSLKSLFQEVRRGVYGDVKPENVKDALTTFGTTYSIDETSRLTRVHFAVPFMQKTVANL